MNKDLTWNSEINQCVHDQLIINNSFPTFERYLYKHLHRGNYRYVWITSIKSSLNAIKDISLRVTAINLVSASSYLPKENWDLEWNTCVFSICEAINDQNIWIFHDSERHKRKTLIGFTVSTAYKMVVKPSQAGQSISSRSIFLGCKNTNLQS